jgi:hypothetical protein
MIVTRGRLSSCQSGDTRVETATSRTTDARYAAEPDVLGLVISA